MSVLVRGGWVWVGVEFAELMGFGGCGGWFNCGFVCVCARARVLFLWLRVG